MPRSWTQRIPLRRSTRLSGKQQPPGTAAAEVIQTVTAQLFFRLFVAGEPLTQETADRAAAIAAAAARAGALSAAPRSR